MTEISSMLMDISLSGYYQTFTFANIGPVLDNTVSLKNLINKTRSNKWIGAKHIKFYMQERTNVCYNRARVWREHALNNNTWESTASNDLLGFLTWLLVKM
jgi:hypothetical protein